MSIICRPKASEGDRIWTDWLEAAHFCSISDRRYDIRVKLGEPAAHDGPGLTVAGPAAGGTNFLSNQRSLPRPSQYATDLQKPSFIHRADVFLQAPMRNLKCRCGPGRLSSHWPIEMVEANGKMMRASCPQHPCWDISRPIITIETIEAKASPKHPAYKESPIINQEELYARYKAKAIPIIRGSAQYFTVLSEAIKPQISPPPAGLDGEEREMYERTVRMIKSEADYNRQGHFPFMSLPAELREVIYRYIFAGDESLICTWPSPAPLPFTKDIDERVSPFRRNYGTVEEYHDLEEVDGTLDHYLPKTLLAGIWLLTMSKMVNREASPLLYTNRTFRFSSHHLTRLFTNRSLFDQLHHVELEDFKCNSHLNLVPVIKALHGGKSVQDITIGNNVASMLLGYGGKITYYNGKATSARPNDFKALWQVSEFKKNESPLRRLTVRPLPKLSFYNFTKMKVWKQRGYSQEEIAGFQGSEASLNEDLCQLGIRLFEKE